MKWEPWKGERKERQLAWEWGAVSGGGGAAQEEHDFSQAPKAQEDRFVKSHCSDAKRTSDNIRA